MTGCRDCAKLTSRDCGKHPQASLTLSFDQVLRDEFSDITEGRMVKTTGKVQGLQEHESFSMGETRKVVSIEVRSEHPRTVVLVEVPPEVAKGLKLGDGVRVTLELM